MLQMTHHGHYRPDMVTRTGVIEPYNIRKYNPGEVARHTIDPFIYGVRGRGPSVAPALSSMAIANAAAAVAESFKNGKRARITVGHYVVDVGLNEPCPDGLIGQIVEAARGIVAGQTVLVQSPGTKAAFVRDNSPKATTNSNVSLSDAMQYAPSRPGLPPARPTGYTQPKSMQMMRRRWPELTPPSVTVPSPTLPYAATHVAPFAPAGPTVPQLPAAVASTGARIAMIRRQGI